MNAQLLKNKAEWKKLIVDLNNQDIEVPKTIGLGTQPQGYPAMAVLNVIEWTEPQDDFKGFVDCLYVYPGDFVTNA